MVVKTQMFWVYEMVEDFLEGWGFDIAIPNEKDVIPMNDMSRQEIFQHFGATNELKTFENALEKTLGKYTVNMVNQRGHIQFYITQLTEE